MRLLALLLFVALFGGHTCAQSTPPSDPKIVLKVAIANDQREFRMGEAIPLQLGFSSAVKNHYRLNMAQYDRSGRMNYEQFKISPSVGWVDPLPNQLGSMGGLTSFKFLSTESWTIKLNLNEWVRFTQPGEYRLIVTSNRVEVRDPSSPSGSAPVTARSNEITLKIVSADPAWQKRVFKEAVAKLDTPSPPESNQSEQFETARRQAFETLRFLGTPDATRELVQRMRGEACRGFEHSCTLGIISSPERSIARSALEEAVADPNQLIDGNLLYTFITVSLDTNANNRNWQETQQRVLEQVVAALPGKRGKALSISLSTALSQAWAVNALPQQTTERLTAQLVSLFDKLPLNEQDTLLSLHWEKIKSPALLPILKRYAQSDGDSREMRAEPYQSLRLSGNALRRWYELDPAGARSTIITEMSLPRPRFDARVLGLLPDKVLPEVDFVLAEHFSATDDFDCKSKLASLIARYATDAILPQIVEQLDPKIGKWDCAIQNPLLAYVLRVDPASARLLIERSIAARGNGSSSCNESLFQNVSEIHYDPILEEIGIKSLNDPDAQVAATAATMLGKFGSSTAESALQERYASWTEQWRGRETELDRPFDDLKENVYQLGLGQNLMQALTTGKAWLLDKAALQRLAQQTKVRQIRQQLEGDLKLWDDEPLIIHLDSSPFGFHARIAQYEFQSIDALKEKLTQFRSGSTFALFISTELAGQTVAELRTFLSTHGMSVVAEKAP